MRKSLINIIAVLFVALTTIGAFAADDAAAGAKVPGVVNINSADASQFAMLPRIGAKTAERVVAYRTEHGKFGKTTDLMQVKGISDKTFELLNPFLVLDGKTTLTVKQRVARPKKGRTSEAPANPAH